MLLLRTVDTLVRKLPATLRFSSRLLHSFAVEPNMNLVLKKICHTLTCSEQTALTVYESCPNLRSVTALCGITENIKVLTNNGVSKELIGDNPFLLNLEIDALQRKLDTIKQMKPRRIDDFVPLLDMKEPILKQVAMKTVAEYGEIPEKSRIYYWSRELQIAPATVSKYFSKFEVIFFVSFTVIAKKLNILLDYGVDELQILQALYIIRCSDEVCISRLEELFANGLYDFNLCIFKLTDEHFQKVLVRERKNAKQIPNELAHKLNQRNLEKFTILNELNVMLSCDNKVSAQIYYNSINNIEQLPLAKENVKLLADNGVSLEFIQSNSVVLTLPEAQLHDNIKLIKDMNPNSIEDFLPLVEADTSKLKAFSLNIKSKPSKVHPIYFLSNKLNIFPTTVSKYFVRHTHLLFGDDFVKLGRKVDLLVSYNVQPMSILKSTKTFGMSFETLQSKLIDLKSRAIEDISSWMLVCDTSRLKGIVALRVEEKKSFGEATNTVDYLVKRLNWNQAAKDKALKHYPPLAKCSVLRVQAHLDYLLNETHFTAYDINSNASVFRTNLDELKLRMNELATIGLTPRKLYSICLAKKPYLEMVGKHCRKINGPAAFEQFKIIEKRIKNVM